MTTEEKEGIRIFRNMFQNMNLKEMDDLMKNQECHEANSELEFEPIETCSIKEYIRTEKLVLLDDLINRKRY